MQTLFELQICSTGETITGAESELKMWVWQNKIEKKLLKDGRRNQAVRDAILSGDTIVAWVNYDEMLTALSNKEMNEITHRVFSGYDRYTEKKFDKLLKGKTK